MTKYIGPRQQHFDHLTALTDKILKEYSDLPVQDAFMMACEVEKIYLMDEQSGLLAQIREAIV